ncbi:pre-peptidase C-terminal domain-containing protein [Phormidesmis priestleyi]|uniref:pre-peptidase C-terminal domain-containing protein n=1 Tax=Phormidesmis priestleyi TaxID=268141 RepID=UPI0009353E5D|nr:pre-peptidase C-terminal domain-containing protein [Phormidesmis priestleyi]
MSNNTLETAKEISLSSSAQTLTDSVSANLTDYYRFQLKSYGSLSTVLDRLSGDANLELIQDRDRNGTVSSSEILAISNNQGAISELVSAVLNPGTYYLRVSTSQDSTRYSLNLSAVFDLKTELTWRNYATGENAVWLMNNSAIESAVFLTKVPGTDWNIEGVADFNHDGQTDVIWRNYATGENAVWLMNNNAIESAVFLTKVPGTDWNIEGVADFNHDGQADVIWRNYVTGENAVWLMNNNVIESAVFLTKVAGTDWNIEGVADFNQDGQTDVIWRNYVTGENAVWLMNNNVIESAVFLTKVADPNWRIEGVGKQFEQKLINDVVGDTIANAFNIGTLDKNATFRESLGSANDLEDDYQFTLSANSSLSLTLNGLSANVDLQLLNSSGAVIQTSAIAGNSAESISSGLLSAGTYYVRLSLNGSDITSYTLNLSAALPIYQYEFTYYYNGSNNCKDYYTGHVYAYADTYSAGQLFDAVIGNNETGYAGKYLIKSAIAAENIADLGKVFVDKYYNSENSTSYTPVYFGQGKTSGTNYLGSEYDFIGNSNSSDNDFGLDKWVYDISYSKYNFIYYYNGKDNTADYYSGWVYAQPGTYTVGSLLDSNPNNNDIGSNGNYSITKSSREGIATDVGKVFVDRYYDIDNSQKTYTPYYFNQGKASGTNLLGSEYDYGNSLISSQTDFGQDSLEFDAQPELFGSFFDIAQVSFTTGDSLTANFKIQNTGADARPFRVAFYLSKDTTMTTDDRLLAICDLDTIAANTLTATISKTLYLPGSADGFWVKDGTNSYHIGMIVDSLNAVSEANESNNANRGIGSDSKEVSITNVVKDPVVNYGAASGNPLIDALLNANRAYWNTSVNGGVITYSFYANASGYTGREIVSEISTTIKNNVRAILSSIESFINVRFVEVADTATSCGVIRYMYSDGKANSNDAAYGFYAYGYYPGSNSGGDIHLNPNRATSFEGSAGTYGYMSLIHETLHTLGLKHPGNYNVGGGTTEAPFLSPTEDNTTNTVMTYNNGTSDTQYHGSKAITPMSYDIRALQYLYGARNQNADATTYTFNTVYGYGVANQFFGSTTTELKQSIWDAGGVDTLDFSGLSGGSSYRFDLNPGGILTTQSSYNGSTYYDYGQDSQPTDGIPQGSQSATSNFGTTIAEGTMIENLITSCGNDYIIANTASNVFKGYTFGTFTGDDVIDSSSAADSLELAGFNLSNLTTAVSGSDLTIGLGSGSIRLQNYYGANGSMKLLVGDTYYTYSSSGSWQAVAVPAAITAPNASLDIVAAASGLTATVASTSQVQPPMSPAACMCPICSGTAVNLLGTSSLVAAIGLG